MGNLKSRIATPRKSSRHRIAATLESAPLIAKFYVFLAGLCLPFRISQRQLFRPRRCRRPNDHRPFRANRSGAKTGAKSSWPKLASLFAGWYFFPACPVPDVRPGSSRQICSVSLPPILLRACRAPVSRRRITGVSAERGSRWSESNSDNARHHA